jgi:hypothetical protein
MSVDRHRESILIFGGQSGALDPMVFECSEDPDAHDDVCRVEGPDLDGDGLVAVATPIARCARCSADA